MVFGSAAAESVRPAEQAGPDVSAAAGAGGSPGPPAADVSAAPFPEEAGEEKAEDGGDREGPAPAASESGPGGDSFGLYELISKIGSSDVAVTYRARDRFRGRIVALKVLAPGPCGSREEISALRERARAARRLSHPNIARVIEVGVTDGLDYVATEFVEGHALTRFLDRDRLSVGEAVVLAGTLASGLDHAHSEGVIHGDLRPSNVIVDNYGNPRLTDFGFAREYWRVEPEALRSSATSDVPLPQYMAPEQLAGEEPTPRSDVYGLGALLYHMLAGQPPFPGRSLLQVVLQVDRGRPPPPAVLVRTIPTAVSAVVMRCLEKDPADRFDSAAELAHEIDKFLRGQKVNARVPGPGTRLVRSLARHWRAAVLVTALAAASAAGAWYAARSQELAKLRSPAAEARLRMADAFDLVRKGKYDEAARAFGEMESDASLPDETGAKAVAGLGLAELKAGRPEAAVEAYARARDKLPGDAELRRQLGLAIWHARGDMTEAARQLGRSLELDPARRRQAKYQYEYARACAGAGLEREAREAFELVRRIDPRYERARVAGHLKRLAGDGG